MSFYASAYCGSIWHHGVKGQKWGIRRTAEELGHTKPKNDAIMDGEVYHSKKGFSVAEAKLSKFFLNAAKKHAKEFFEVGYTANDADRLLKDIEAGFDLAKKSSTRKSPRGDDQFCIPMRLGVTQKRMFTTAWQTSDGEDEPKLITAYLDRRVKEDK